MPDDMSFNLPSRSLEEEDGNQRRDSMISLDLSKTSEISSRFSSNEFLHASASLEDLEDPLAPGTSIYPGARPLINEGSTTVVSSSGSETATLMDRSGPIVENLRSRKMLSNDFLSSTNYRSYLSDNIYDRPWLELLNSGFKPTALNITERDPNSITTALMRLKQYTVSYSRESTSELSSSYYFGVENQSGKKVILKVFSEFNEAVLLSAAINEWYITSSKNPQYSTNIFLDSRRTDFDIEALRNEASSPKTLPRNIPGILYPIRVVSIDENSEDSGKCFALVFEDRDFTTLGDFYSKSISSETGSFKDLSSTVESHSTFDSVLNRSSTHNSTAPSISDEYHETKRKRQKSVRQVVEILTDIITVVKILGKIHDCGIVHNNINTSHILKSSSNPDDIVLHGFRNSFFLQPEEGTNDDVQPQLEHLAENIPYMSPECFGNDNNRGADYRSDFYSVGAVLYELLVGHLPFKNEFPLKLIRMNVSHRPVAPKILASSYISTELSNLIMKLLEKDPWKRYTHATHLANDLRKIRNNYVERIRGNDMESKIHSIRYKKENYESEEVLPRIVFPQKVFGRANEFTTISNIHQSQESDTRFILISGPDGCGKSSMLKDLGDLPLSRQEFYFYLQFNEANRDGVYSSFIHGIRECVKQIIMLGGASIEKWKALIISNISTDVTAIRPMIPELIEILGEYSESGSSLIIETENQTDQGNQISESIGDKAFNMEIKLRQIILKFFHLFAVHGLSVFCDNIEFCSSAEWSIFEEIIHRLANANPKQQSSLTLFIAINSESSEYETWRKTLQKGAFDFKITYGEVQLRGIDEVSFKALWKNSALSDRNSFHYDKDKDAPTGTLKDTNKNINDEMSLSTRKLYNVTKGNILTLKFLIGSMMFKKQVSFIKGRTGNDGEWIVPTEQIPAKLSLEQAVLSFRDLTLNKTCKKILMFASMAIGDTFSLWEISTISNTPVPEVAKRLHYCCSLSLLVPKSGTYKLPFDLLYNNETPFNIDSDTLKNLAQHATYSFIHGSVRKLFRQELVEADLFTQYHKLAAHQLYKSSLQDPIQDPSHLLAKGRYFLESADLASYHEVDLYFEVLIRAGKAALAVFNFRESLRYFSRAQKLVESNDNKRNIQCVITISQLYFYMESFDECLSFIDMTLDRYNFQENILLLTKIRCLNNLGRHQESIASVVIAVKKFGFEVGETPKENIQIYKKYVKKIPTSISEIRNLTKLEAIRNNEVINIFEFISEIVFTCYLVQENDIRNLLTVQAINLSATTGSSAYCAIPMIDYANCLAKSGNRAKFLSGIEYVNLALAFVENDTSASFTYVQHVYEVYSTSFASYIENMGDVLRYQDLVISSGQPCSRFNNTARNFLFGLTRMHLLYLTGHAYNTIYTETCRQSIASPVSECFKMQEMGLKLLHGDIGLSEFEKLYAGKTKTTVYRFGFNFFKVWYLNCQGRYEELMKTIQQDSFDDMVPNTVLHIDYFFAIAVALGNSTLVPPSVKRLWTDKVYEFFEMWSSINPRSFKSKFILVGLLLRKDPKMTSLSILDSYEEAIEIAQTYNNWYEVAWANLLCANWLSTSNKNNKRISVFIRNALTLFRSLDASLLSDTIESKFRHALEDYNWAGIDDIKHSNSSFTPLSPSSVPLNRKLHSMVSESSSVNTKRSTTGLSLSLEEIGNEKDEEPVLSIDLAGNVDLNLAVKACLDISDTLTSEAAVIRLLKSAITFSSADYGVVVMKGSEEVHIQAVGSSKKIYQLDKEPLSSRTDLCPLSLVLHVLQTGEIVDKEKEVDLFRERFANDDYFFSNNCYASLCIPLKNDEGIYGVLYLERSRNNSPESLLEEAFFDNKKRDLINLLCSQASVTLTKLDLYSQMETAKRIAEDATAEKASFLANMSHEIRTPFNSLLSCSIFLLDTKLSKTQREYVETIKNSAMVTLNIIDGILAFSKIEHGSFTLDCEPFSVVESIENAIQLVGEQAGLKNLELVFFNNAPYIISMYGDETRFRQIIINLVGNAVKFTSDGHIIVQLDAKEITDYRYEIDISVEDTGVGIPEGSNNKVFGAFSQVDSSSRRIHGGSGLGLALSKKLVELMGGTLTFDSIEGQGSTFYFNFAADIDRDLDITSFSGRNSPALGQNPSVINKKVLIIDRLQLTRKSLKELLLWYGFEVFLADSVEDYDTNESFIAVFVSYEQLVEFNKIRKQVNERTKIIIISQFGKPLPIEIDDNDIYHIVLVPFQRRKIVGLLRNLCNSKKSVDSEPEPQKLSELYPLRIILAEDNLINYKVALQHLKKLGYEADHARDGVEVIDKCLALLENNEGYDVILMDIQMPRKDGITATKELRELFTNDGRTDLLPEIVALTANVAGEDRARSLECGMVDFVSKPILPENLRKVLVYIGERRQK